MLPSTAETLRKTPLFANLPPGDLARVAGMASLKRLARKGSVFREGDRADGFFVVAEGRVKVFKLSEEGKEQVLHLVGPGQSFAEATIFEGGVYPAHAEALDDCELIYLPKRQFTDMIEKDPRIALRMMASLSRWLKRMIDLVENISLRDVETRLVRFVSEEMKSRGVPIRDGATRGARSSSGSTTATRTCRTTRRPRTARSSIRPTGASSATRSSSGRRSRSSSTTTSG